MHFHVQICINRLHLYFSLFCTYCACLQIVDQYIVQSEKTEIEYFGACVSAVGSLKDSLTAARLLIYCSSLLSHVTVSKVNK